MRTRPVVFIAALMLLSTAVHAANEKLPALVRRIPLPEVRGRIDHMYLDEKDGRLFIAALGNDSVEVVDVASGSLLKSLTGLPEPQGVVVHEGESGSRLYVSCGGDGVLRVLDSRSLDIVASLALGDDADNVHLDAPRDRVLVGFGSGGIAVVDTRTNAITHRIELPSHPESFQLDADGVHAFVNLPGAHSIARIDLETGSVSDSWSPGLAAANYPMAIDVANRRLFIACRLPSRLLVIDADDGRHVARLDLHGDCDDVFYDRTSRRIYASCGQGFVDVFTQEDADNYSASGAVETRVGARTSLLAGESYFVALPRNSGRPAEIRCFKIGRAPEG